jgi:hypothetical protein
MLLPVLLLLSLGSCSDATPPDPAAEGSTETPAPEPVPPKKVERSYSDPSMPATEEEKADIAAVCGALMTCMQGPECDEATFGDLVKKAKVKTAWGKLMIEHFNGADPQRSCRRIVKLLQADNLTNFHPDCRYLVDRCG